MDHLTFAQLLGNYGEFVGAVAVVVTLGYIAVQVRQNSKSLDASTSQELLGQINIVNISLIENPGALSDFEDYLAGGKNKESRTRGQLVMRTMMNNYFQAYVLYRSGCLQEKVWANIDFNCTALLKSPGGKHWFEHGVADDLSPEFREHIRIRLSD